MINSMHPSVLAALLFLVFALVSVADNAQEVKFCKNATTGEIIVVEVGYPCPFPTHEI